MVGIYIIINLLTGQSYIGQSKDIEQRFKEHIYHSESYIDQEIQELGKENFYFGVLELCDESQLDSKEDFYIKEYHSNEFGYGYNIVRGGQHNIGESNSNAKLTEQDVFDIRESYNRHERKSDVYEKYKHKITKSYFSNVWEGRCWHNIHYDVYSRFNLDYYKYQTSLGGCSFSAIFTNEEVIELRKRYVNETAKSIYESVKDRCSYNTLQAMLWGRSYSYLPIYDKKNKKWIVK